MAFETIYLGRRHFLKTKWCLRSRFPPWRQSWRAFHRFDLINLLFNSQDTLGSSTCSLTQVRRFNPFLKLLHNCRAPLRNLLFPHPNSLYSNPLVSVLRQYSTPGIMPLRTCLICSFSVRDSSPCKHTEVKL